MRNMYLKIYVHLIIKYIYFFIAQIKTANFVLTIFDLW